MTPDNPPGLAASTVQGLDATPLMQALAATALNPLFVLDTDHRCRLVNLAGAALIGRTAAAVIGLRLVDLLDPADATAVEAACQRVLAGETLDLNVTVHPATGPRRLHVQMLPLHDAARGVTGILGMAEDIQERRMTIQALREREQRLEQALEAAQMHVWTLHTPSRRLSVADTLCTAFGLAPEFCRRLGPWRRRLHPDDRGRVEQSLRRLIETGVPLREEFRVLRAGSEPVWLDARALLIPSDDGRGAQVHGVAADITQRKLQEYALHENNQRLRLALQSASLSAWMVVPESRRVVADDGIFRMFGLMPGREYTPAEWAATVHPDDLPYVMSCLRDVLSGGRDYEVEFRVVHPDGRVRLLNSQLVLVKDAQGALAGVGVAGDVTEKRHLERQLRESERELRMITSAAPIGIVRISRDLRYLFVNESHAENLLASVPDQIIGRSLQEVLGTSALAVLQPQFEQVLAGRQVDFETPMQMPRGYRYIHASLIPERDELQNIVSFVAVIEDITERKLAEARLYERERDFKALAENAPDLTARLDRDLAYLYINRAAEMTFGVNRERYVGRRASELGFPPEYCRATDRAVAAAFSGGAEQSASFSVRDGGSGDATAADDHRHFVARAVPEFDRIGLIDSVLLIVYDVSERVRVQIERDTLLASEHEAREVAEAAARGRDEFLAIVSHELRSPLNGIQSWAHVLETTLGDGPKVVRRALAGIRTGVEQQVRLIDDLLDATRIISGKLSLSVAPVRVLPALTAALESVHAKAAEKSIELVPDIMLGDESIEGDADRLQQIVWNLLTNAIKFTPSGGHVWLSARREQDEVLIEVRDDGRGIDADFLPQLFKRFRRDETGNSRGQDGLGLGLMLVRHLCELHRGSVTATSLGPGQGAAFILRLPLRGSSQPLAPVGVSVPLSAATLPSLSELRVLLVDDHLESRDSLAVLLARAGASVDVLSNGGEAVRRIETGHRAQQPDVLVCDIAMPDKDGYETLREIRALERRLGLPRLPAIALTAFAQNEDRLRALEAGFQSHLCKPVAVEELIVTIAAFAGHRGSAV